MIWQDYVTAFPFEFRMEAYDQPGYGEVKSLAVGFHMEKGRLVSWGQQDGEEAQKAYLHCMEEALTRMMMAGAQMIGCGVLYGWDLLRQTMKYRDQAIQVLSAAPSSMGGH